MHAYQVGPQEDDLTLLALRWVERAPDTARPTNLPLQLTSFIGREQELAEVEQLLATARLLTLVGPPGTGKTRLAVPGGPRSDHGIRRWRVLCPLGPY